jgi:hypothetical protein
MNATQPIVEPATLIALAEGVVVTILGDFRFTDMQGLIIDMNSNQRPEDGPIAVYFDIEVPDHEFGIFGDKKKWTCGIPTKENYRACYRVRYFKANELRGEAGFPLEVIAQRRFDGKYLFVQELNFPLRPGTHECQLQSCKSGLLATELTLVNFVGTIMSVYTCAVCHKEWDKMRTESLELKKPLPGAPAKAN